MLTSHRSGPYYNTLFCDPVSRPFVSLFIIRSTFLPVLSLAGIICEHYGVLCESGPWSFKTAHAYLSILDFISIS